LLDVACLLACPFSYFLREFYNKFKIFFPSLFKIKGYSGFISFSIFLTL